MIKKLCTLLMLTILSAPLLAQTVGSESDGVLFAPKKGQYLSCWAEVTISTMKKPPTCSLPSPIPAVRSDCPTKVRHHRGT